MPSLRATTRNVDKKGLKARNTPAQGKVSERSRITPYVFDYEAIKALKGRNIKYRPCMTDIL